MSDLRRKLGLTRCVRSTCVRRCRELEVQMIDDEKIESDEMIAFEMSGYEL